MFYKRIGFFNDTTKDLFVYQIPDRLTDEQVVQYLEHEGFSMEDGKWFEINNLSTGRKMRESNFRRLFPSEGLNGKIRLITEYFGGYSSRNGYYIQMKSIACKYLYGEGLIMHEIRDALNYKNHTSVVFHINYYKDFTEISIDDFWDRVENKIYPMYVDNKLIWQKNEGL